MSNNELSKALLENVKVFHNLFKSVNTEFTRKHKDSLTERQFFALASISKYEKIELKNLSKDLYVSTSSLCILLNKLVDQDYVYREEDSRDRRNTFYGITTKGREILERDKSGLLEILSSKMGILDDDKKEELLKSLSQVQALIQQMI